jgi:hypothetical protein
LTFVLGKFDVFGAKKSKAFEVATTLSSDTTTTLDFLGFFGFLMAGQPHKKVNKIRRQ